MGTVAAPGGGVPVGARRRLAPTSIHDDGHRTPLRHLLSQQQIGWGTAALRPYIYQVSFAVP